MSMFDCIQSAMDDTGEDGVKADRARGERAQAMWREMADTYERQGHPRQTAEQLAADDLREAFKREAGEKRHFYTSKMASMRRSQAHVNSAAAPDMTRRMNMLDFQHRGIVRRFNGKMGAYLKEHHRDLLGRITNPAQQAHIADELHGIASGNPHAKALADGIRDALEELRVMFNEAGGAISKLDNWGVAHVHDALAVRRAGFQRWFSEIDGKLDWARIIDPLTGRPMQIDTRTGLPPLEARQSYLKSSYDNIVFSKEADEVAYGRPKGVATYRKHMDQRHLHFKSGADWMAYNKQFGTGGLHQSLMGHVHRMARDISLMREFGPNPKLGAEYEADLWRARAKREGNEGLLDAISSDSSTALRMLNVMSGGNVSSSLGMQMSARFFSTARNLMTSAFLDRAVIASVSDMNTSRMAAKSMQMNPSNIMGKLVGALPSLSRDELLRAGWVADTMADAGSALARFQAEVAPTEWAERVTQASMRIQGLSAWTDRARAINYQEFSGYMASQADRSLADLDPALRSHLAKWGVTAADWDEFRRVENLLTAGNGATFAMPLHFRNVTTLDRQAADRLFFKMQGAAEEWLELAVPTRSLLGQAWTDPAAVGLPPGHPLYEVAKSATMFKSFPITFTINQYRQVQARGGFGSIEGMKYALDLAAGATIFGAVSLQIGDLLMGRDPQDMTNPMFWGRAATKGGGFGVIGDIVTTGQASWGGGFAGYVAGPVPQMMTDVWGVTLGPAMTKIWGEATGEEVDTNYAQKLAKFGKRYTPMGQTPLVGPAIDRNIWDRLQIFLDPESVDALERASRNRENLTGAGEFWLPGQSVPSRAPNLGTAIGQ